MQKYSTLKNMFFLRDKKDWAKCYERVDFWVTILAGVCLLLSFVLARYVDGSGNGTTYAQMWRGTGANWTLVLCGIGTAICGLYIIIVNMLFRNNAVLSSINIGLGIFIAVLFVIEYVVLKKVGFESDGDIVVMANTAGIGFYLGVVGAIVFAGLEFYKLGSQGYYTSEEVEKQRRGEGVEVVDGVVMVDGEAIQVSNEKVENEREVELNITEQPTQDEVTPNEVENTQEKDAKAADKKVDENK